MSCVKIDGKILEKNFWPPPGSATALLKILSLGSVVHYSSETNTFHKPSTNSLMHYDSTLPLYKLTSVNLCLNQRPLLSTFHQLFIREDNTGFSAH